MTSFCDVIFVSIPFVSFFNLFNRSVLIIVLIIVIVVLLLLLFVSSVVIAAPNCNKL